MRGKLTMVLVVMFLGFMVADVQAFCVYNKINNALITVKQTSGGAAGREFSADIKPNESACCNWQTKDCNTSGKRDGIVHFTIKTTFDVDPIKTACSDFPTQAGGWLTVEGRDGNYKCVRHDYQ